MISLRLKLQPHTAVGWTDCFVVHVASVADGPQIGQVFWSGVIDRLTGRAPSLRAVPDGQGHTAILAANFLMRGTDHGSFSGSVSHCPRLPAITQILLTCCCHRTTLYYTTPFPSSAPHHCFFPLDVFSLIAGFILPQAVFRHF